MNKHASLLLALTMAAFTPAHAPASEMFPSLTEKLEQIMIGRGGLDMNTVGAIGTSGPGMTRTALPLINREMTLRGEEDRISWPLYLTAADLVSEIEITIGFRNAVAVAKETSSLSLEVNGRQLAIVPIANPDQDGKVTATIPGDMLQPGYNAVSVHASQRHRVDCTTQATYELWTEIKQRASWISISRSRNRIQRITDLPALARNENQQVSIAVIRPQANLHKAGWTAEMLKLLQVVTLLGDINMPSLHLADADENTISYGSGIDLFYGSPSALAAYVRDKRYEGGIEDTPYGKLQFFTSPEHDRILIGATPGLTPQAGPRIQTRHGTPEGLVAHTYLGNFRPRENQSFTLREVGYREQPFTGHLFRTRLPLHLPADFYSADYDSIDLHLFGAYSKGLKPGQRLTILVNGVSHVSIKLGNPNGEILNNRVIEIPLSAFSPGANTVELMAELHASDDKECTFATTGSSMERFFLSEESYFTIPKVAHLKRFPAIANTLITGFPYSSPNAEPTQLILSDDHAETFLSAATLVSNLSFRSGQLINYDVAQSRKPEAGRDAIVVGPYESLAANVKDKVAGLDLQRLAFSSRRRMAAIATTDRISTGSIPGQTDERQAPVTKLVYPSPISGQPSGSSELSEFLRTEARAKRSDWFDFPLEQLSLLLGPISKIFRHEQKAATLDPDNTAFVAAQKIGDRGEKLTIIAGATAMDLEKGFRSMIDIQPPHVDEVAGIGISSGSVSFHPAQHSTMDIPASWSLTNLRLVIAGWLSNHPVAYGFMTLLFTLLAGIASALVLRKQTSGNSGGNDG